MKIKDLWQEVDVLEHIKYLLNNLNDMVIVHSLEHKIIWMNQKGLDYYKMPLADLKGKHCYELKFKNKQSCSNCPVKKVIKNPIYQEKELRNPAGEILLVRAYPIKSRQGEVVGILEMATDMTKSNYLKEKNRNNEMKNEFFTNLSHEFRTPLNLIYSASQILKSKVKKVEKDDKMFNCVENIQKNYYRLLKMVNNLLDITKMDSGFYELNFQNHDIVKILRDITKSTTDYIINKERDFQINFSINKKILACDKFNIERVILNLLSNALKFTKQGDKIIVSIREGENNSVVISIKDTGIGIRKDKIANIFERYKQINKDYQGTGLGLSIVKSIIDMHQGDIEVLSKEGVGTEFIIKLPIKKVDKNPANNTRIYSDLTKVDLEFSDVLT